MNQLLKLLLGADGRISEALSHFASDSLLPGHQQGSGSVCWFPPSVLSSSVSSPTITDPVDIALSVAGTFVSHLHHATSLLLDLRSPCIDPVNFCVHRLRLSLLYLNLLFIFVIFYIYYIYGLFSL